MSETEANNKNEQMDEITFGFSRPRGFSLGSWVIRLVERRPYSHVYIKRHSEWMKRDLIYQATATMVHFIGSKLFIKDSCRVVEYSFDITKEREKELMAWCVDNAGLSYGFKQILGMAYVRFLEFLGKTDVHNPFADSSRATWICSKLAAIALVDILQAAEISEKDLANAGPSMVEKILQTIPNVRVTNYESC